MKASIMKKTVVFAVAATLAGGVTNAATEYSVADNTLTISVPEGETNSVVVAELACANNNKVTRIVKTGRGGFMMDDKTAIPQYEGDIHVNEGTWIVACTNALGKLDNGKGENTGKVFVADGATIDMASTDRYLSNSGKKITIKGDGVSGNGALTVSVLANNYYKDVLGNNIVLDGDASIGMSGFNLYLLGSIIDLNNHKLIVKGGQSGSNSTIVLGGNDDGSTVKRGEIEFKEYGCLLLQANTFFEEGCRITFNDNASLTAKMTGRYDVPVIWDSSGRIYSEAVVQGDITNTWHGSVELQKSMRIAIAKSGTFGLAGKVSGAGGLNMYWNSSTIPDVPVNSVSLANDDNNFEGGVSVKELIVNVKENGAVPTDGGVFALTNSIANFDPLKNYMLPDGIIHVDEDKDRSVNGGLGKWKKLVKTGAGTVDYDSAIGANELELREGILKLSVPQTNFVGLIEGVQYFTDGETSANAAKNAKIAYTNGVVLSPYLMNSAMKSYWTTARPDWDVEDKTIKGHCTTYSGYMWNRETTNVMWTFVSCVANRTTLHIDDEHIFTHIPSSSAKTLGKGTIEVTPGAHRFRIGNHSSYHSNNPLKTEGGMSGSVEAWKGMGLRWDPLGRDTTDPANFEILEDPGDGSLFTWAIPGEDVFYPGTDESIKLGKFQRVKFSGGTLHLNGVTNRVSEVEGMPLVVGSGRIVVQNKWTIDAADIINGSSTAATGVSFGFGEDVELEINDPNVVYAANAVREWTLVESAENIAGAISIKDEVGSGLLVVKIVGNAVKLKRRPGTVMVIR